MKSYIYIYYIIYIIYIIYIYHISQKMVDFVGFLPSISRQQRPSPSMLEWASLVKKLTQWTSDRAEDLEDSRRRLWYPPKN